MTKIERLADCVTLYCGDCREILPSIERADHVLFDPPYEKRMHAAKSGKGNSAATKQIAALDFQSIDGMREEIAREVQRISQGWSITFCTPEGVAPWRDAYEAAGSRYKRACVWHKPDATPQLNGQGPGMGVEMFTAVWHAAGHSRWNGGGKLGHYTAFTHSRDREGTHPTEKPLSLMVALVNDFTDHGQLILDPFMGSGTTGVACAKRGRDFIGIEINEKYFDVSRRRIDLALRSPDFFTERQPKARQAPLFAKDKA